MHYALREGVGWGVGLVVQDAGCRTYRSAAQCAQCAVFCFRFRWTRYKKKATRDSTLNFKSFASHLKMRWPRGYTHGGNQRSSGSGGTGLATAVHYYGRT
jgi:hypothetical protein